MKIRLYTEEVVFRISSTSIQYGMLLFFSFLPRLGARGWVDEEEEHRLESTRLMGICNGSR